LHDPYEPEPATDPDGHNEFVEYYYQLGKHKNAINDAYFHDKAITFASHVRLIARVDQAHDEYGRVTRGPFGSEDGTDPEIKKPADDRGAGVIFHILDTDQFLFYLRDDKDTIPFPNMTSILGGHFEDGEGPYDCAMRELKEELLDLKTGKPFEPTGLKLIKQWVDEQNIEQTIFGCELPTSPLLWLREGNHLVRLNRDQIPSTNFAFHFNDIVQEYAATV
jgi:hypothetical protein